MSRVYIYMSHSLCVCVFVRSAKADTSDHVNVSGLSLILVSQSVNFVFLKLLDIKVNYQSKETMCNFVETVVRPIKGHLGLQAQ